MKRIVLAVAMLMLGLALGASVASCGTRSPAPASSDSPAMQRFAEVLGHEPAGIARKIAESGTISVATDSDYAPQSYIDDTGQPQGFDVDTAKRLGELLGVKVKFVYPYWATIPGKLAAGEFDVSIGSMAFTEERDKTLDFADPYYYTKGQVIMKEGGRPISRVEDLFGHTVAVARDTTYESFLQHYPQIRLKRYASDSNAFRDLKSGKVEYHMMAATSEQQAILDGWPFELTGPPLFYEDLSFAIREGEPDLRMLLDDAVATMHADGSLTKMSIQWHSGLDLSVK